MGQISLAPNAVVDQLLQEDPSDTYESVFEKRGHIEHETPAHALMFAILCDGLHILLVTPLNRRHHLEYQEALSWFHEPAHTHLYSFATICDFLHFDTHRIRAGMEWLLAGQAVQAYDTRPLMRRDYVRPLRTKPVHEHWSDDRPNHHARRVSKAGVSNTVLPLKPPLPPSLRSMLPFQACQRLRNALAIPNP